MFVKVEKKTIEMGVRKSLSTFLNDTPREEDLQHIDTAQMTQLESAINEKIHVVIVDFLRFVPS